MCFRRIRQRRWLTDTYWQLMDDAPIPEPKIRKSSRNIFRFFRRRTKRLEEHGNEEKRLNYLHE